mgnify:FL=1
MLGNSVFANLKAKNHSLRADDYSTSVTFSGNYAVGDYIEFVKVNPIDAGTSGYYYISISYTRGSIAASATHVAAISHANPAIWRETGRVNSNKYVDAHLSFTVDCNTEYNNVRFRVRAVATHGIPSDISVNIKIHSINFNSGFTPINNVGNDINVQKFLPMTNDWDLYVGNMFTAEGASIAIKALQNGNVGIGTTTPQEKLSVNGKIRAKEIKVETANWPDYVFKPDYEKMSLQELDAYVKANGHLPEVPAAADVEKEGIALGEMNKILLKKIEELTLHLIEKDKQLAEQLRKNQSYEDRLLELEKTIKIKKK